MKRDINKGLLGTLLYDDRVRNRSVAYAYMGSTQSSSLINMPMLLADPGAGGADLHITGGSTLYINNDYGASTAGTYKKGQGFGRRLWVYHTTDMTSAPWDSAYFTDAGAQGMRPGDVMFMVRQGTSLGTSQYLSIGVIGNVSTSGAAYVSTQSILTSS
mgnify:CR=1 FL=1